MFSPVKLTRQAEPLPAGVGLEHHNSFLRKVLIVLTCCMFPYLGSCGTYGARTRELHRDRVA